LIKRIFYRFFDLKSKQTGLESSKIHLKQLITDASKEQYLLKTNVQGIEKYAREKYMMKKITKIFL